MQIEAESHTHTRASGHASGSGGGDPQQRNHGKSPGTLPDTEKPGLHP